MYQSDSRALARNTYSLDLSGLFAHVRDTIAAYRSIPGSPAEDTRSWALPRSRVGPVAHNAEAHGPANAWRLR